MAARDETGRREGRRRPVPEVRFLPPALPAVLLPRLGLCDRLGDPGGRPFSLVTGPAGAGKSTLVRQWLERSQPVFTWLTIDASTATATQFWAAVVTGVQRALPGAVLDAVDAIGSDTFDAQAIVEMLADDLLESAQRLGPMVVVVDDAHLLSGEAWQQIRWLLDHHPPGFHLVALSRADPPFPIARLRSQGAIYEVRAADLVLDRTETAELLSHHSVGDEWADFADALHDRTRGWVAGVRVAILATQRGAAPGTVMAQLSAGTGAVAELLVTEALDLQPAHVREFLRLTSPLTTLEPSICDAITGRHDSRDVLRRLAADHVFVAPVENAVDRFRYHPLLAEILRLELRSADPAAESKVLDVAARWMLARDRYGEAVEYALDGSHFELAFGVIVEHLRDLYALGRRSDVGRWLDRLPDAFLMHDADRTVHHCGALLFLIRTEWLRWLRRAEVLVDDRRPDLLARLQVFRALGRAGQGQSTAFDQHLRAAEALDENFAGDGWGEVVQAWRARLATLAGRHDEAVRSAVSLVERERSLIGDLPAMSLLAATLRGGGDLAGDELTDEVVRQWRADGEPDYPGMGDALSVAADIRRDGGDLDEAEVLASSAAAVTASNLPNLLTVRAAVAVARVEGARGHVESSATRLIELRSTMVEQSASRRIVALLGDALADITDAPPIRPATTADIDSLTERELTILGYLAGHLTFPEIADELYISRHTVKTHVARIYRKLGVSRRSAAVRTAREHRLI